jgi:diaminopimelate epimerase
MKTSALTLSLLFTLAQDAQCWVSNTPASFGNMSTSVRGTSLFSAAGGEQQQVKIAKYEGLGNDFILIDARNSQLPPLTPEESAKLCNRNFSVGADGVIFALAPPEGQESEYDFSMRIYNSDGSEPEMCGNGIRCLAAFLKDLGEDAESYNINTLAGPIVPVMNADGTITVDMGVPILKAADVPTTLEPNSDVESVVEQSIEANGKVWKVSAVSMGNPHAIIFVDDLENDIDFEVDGPALEAHPSFPAKTNVEFVQVMSDTHLKMKVWERGAGPTLACGTGTCALVVAAIRAGKIPRPDGEGSSVRVTLPGGDLFIEWRESNNKIYMSGPAELSFNAVAVLK